MEIKFETEGCKTYATKENAVKAVVKKGFEQHRYFIMTNENGRFFPVFLGEKALQYGIHFHFHVTF